MALAILGNIATTARGFADAPLARGHSLCVGADLRQISDEFRTSFVARRPHCGRAATLKSNECACGPRPQHHTQTMTLHRGQTCCGRDDDTSFSTCVTSTSDEKRVFAVSSHTRMWVCVLVPRGSLFYRGASTCFSHARPCLAHAFPTPTRPPLYSPEPKRNKQCGVRPQQSRKPARTHHESRRLIMRAADSS